MELPLHLRLHAAFATLAPGMHHVLPLGLALILGRLPDAYMLNATGEFARQTTALISHCSGLRHLIIFGNLRCRMLHVRGLSGISVLWMLFQLKQ